MPAKRPVEDREDQACFDDDDDELDDDIQRSFVATADEE
jgi:hypothetical protein